MVPRFLVGIEYFECMFPVRARSGHERASGRVLPFANFEVRKDCTNTAKRALTRSGITQPWVLFKPRQLKFPLLFRVADAVETVVSTRTPWGFEQLVPCDVVNVGATLVEPNVEPAVLSSPLGF